MDPGSLLLIIILIVLIALSGFFSASETAFTVCSKMKMRTMAEEGNRRAADVLKLTDQIGQLLSAILICNNIVNLSASSIGTTLAVRSGMSGGAAVATGILTFIILIFGENTPKNLATIKCDQMALRFVHVFHWITVLLTPLIWIVNHICRFLMRLIGVNPDDNSQSISESELRTIVDFSHEEGVIETEEHKMITNVVDFGDSIVKDIMIPRVDMTFLSTDMSMDDILEIMREEMYTRYPVFEESKDSVIGILNIKDLFFWYAHHAPESFRVRDIMREPMFSYEYQKTSVLMEQMKQRSVSITIVLDEYGSVCGMVTLEDLIEEIVGDIRDEYDENEREMIVPLGDGRYEVDASIKINDFNDVAGTDIQSEDYDSIGGHIIELLDSIPEEGDTAEEDGISYKVISRDKTRIDRVLITIKRKEERNNDEKISGRI